MDILTKVVDQNNSIFYYGICKIAGGKHAEQSRK